MIRKFLAVLTALCLCFETAHAVPLGQNPALPNPIPTSLGGTGNTFGVVAGVSNFDPSLLPYARAAMAKARTNTGRMKIAIPGDSTSVGVGSTSNIRNNGFPAVTARLLNNVGISTSYESVFSDGFVGPAGDTRINYGTGWAANGINTLGGQSFKQSTNTGTSLAFTPGSQINQCDVYYFDMAATSAFTVDANGTGTVTVVGTATATILKRTITFTLGTPTINVIATAVGVPIYILGLDCYNATTQQVSIMNFGVSGSVSSYFASGTPYNLLGLLAPDLTLIDLGINDENVGGYDAVAYTANIQAIITKAKLSGDVILIFHHDCSGHTASEALTLAALQSLAASNNLPLVSFATRMGSWTQANALGEMNNALHPNNVGYGDQARMIADLLSKL